MRKKIAEWLGERRIAELRFFAKRHCVDSAESKEDVHEVVMEIKEAYQFIERLFEEDKEQFHKQWLATDGWPDIDKRDDFMLAVCDCFASYELGEEERGEDWLGGPIRLFEFVDERGSHYKGQQKATTAQVKNAAEAVIERDGWDSYPSKRRSQNGKGPGFPNAFVEAVAREVEERNALDNFSGDSVRRHLSFTDLRRPSWAGLRRR